MVCGASSAEIIRHQFEQKTVNNPLILIATMQEFDITSTVLCSSQALPANISRSGTMRAKVSPIRPPCGSQSKGFLHHCLGWKRRCPVIFNIVQHPNEHRTQGSRLWQALLLQGWRFGYMIKLQSAFIWHAWKGQTAAAQACGSHLGNQCGEKCSNSSCQCDSSDPF